MDGVRAAVVVRLLDHDDGLQRRKSLLLPSTANRSGYRPGPGQSASCFNLRQTITGKAGFIASSKNKTWKQTKVLSESDVYSVSPPELCSTAHGDAQLDSQGIDTESEYHASCLTDC